MTTTDDDFIQEALNWFSDAHFPKHVWSFHYGDRDGVRTFDKKCAEHEMKAIVDDYYTRYDIAGAERIGEDDSYGHDYLYIGVILDCQPMKGDKCEFKWKGDVIQNGTIVKIDYIFDENDCRTVLHVDIETPDMLYKHVDVDDIICLNNNFF